MSEREKVVGDRVRFVSICAVVLVPVSYLVFGNRLPIAAIVLTLPAVIGLAFILPAGRWL